MKSLLKKARENKKGFTLAELLVVVANRWYSGCNLYSCIYCTAW